MRCKECRFFSLKENSEKGVCEHPDSLSYYRLTNTIEELSGDYEFDYCDGYWEKTDD